MKLKEMVMVALEGVWVNKLRSVLTMLGIIIGVLSVIIIIMLGLGLEQKTAQEGERMGVNSFILTPKTNEDGEKGKLTLEDCNYIKDSLESIELVVPFKTNYHAALVTPRKKTSAMLIGTSPDYIKVRNLGLAKGRFFTDVENQMGKRLVVIDTKMAEDLFGLGIEVLGKNVRINQIAFEICGVSKPEPPIAGMQFTPIYVPLKAMLAMEDNQEIEQAIVRVKNAEQFKLATDQIVKMLEIRQGVKGGFEAQSNEQMIAQWKDKIRLITGVFGALAGIALVVGGIGIMNIMLVSVTERTREIGIRVAVGARRKDILIQFLVESAVIATLGGISGMLLGIGGAALICMLLGLPVVFSSKVIIDAFLFSAGIGITFGIYPANRASKLNPIDALRYE